MKAISGLDNDGGLHLEYSLSNGFENIVIGEGLENLIEFMDSVAYTFE